jgi:hypothetical protein
VSRALAPSALAALLLAGCGGGGDPGPALSKTAANLGKIRSGDLALSFLVTPRGEGDEFGFELHGPFSLGGEGSLPVANLDYTQIANGQQATATLISTGSKAYVRIGDTAYELPESETAELRASTSELRAEGGLAHFRVDEWFDDPELSEGGEVGGADTDRIHSDLDTSAAIRDLVQLSGRFGGSVPRLDAHDLRRIEKATQSATIEVYTGKRDRLLRRLQLDADFGLDVPQGLASLLGTTVGADVSFELEIDRPNTTVRVAAPEDALPSSEFPAG